MAGSGKLVGGAVAVLALVLAPGASGHTAHYPTVVDFSYGYVGDNASFFGNISAETKPCERDRVVRVFKERDGEDRLLGKDLSGSLGGNSYEVVTDLPNPVPSGVYYAKVARKLSTPNDHRHVCDPGSASLAIASRAARGDELFTTHVAKKKDGVYKKYIGDFNVPDNSAKDLWFRVRGKPQIEDPLNLRFGDDGTSTGEDGYKVKWFKHGDNITQSVTQKGKPFKLGPGQKKYFNARIKAENPPDGFCLKGSAIQSLAVSNFANVGVNTECAF